jgi:hypothetical protein
VSEVTRLLDAAAVADHRTAADPRLHLGLAGPPLLERVAFVLVVISVTSCVSAHRRLAVVEGHA